MKAAIYCRLSKEDEDPSKESESIQNQKSMLVKYAVEKGFDIYNIYCDEDYSGIDRNRPDFNKMLQAASEHRFDIILAKTQARFTRDMELVEKYLHGKFVEWGIRFVAVVDHVDTADIANKKSRQINGLVNEWYLEDLSHNVRSVLDHKRREGKYIATFALYGYEKNPTDHNSLVIDPEAAAVVKRIFALFLAGNGTTKIARMLNQEGIPSPTKYKQEHGQRYKIAAKNPCSDLWGKATVYRMLTTRTYAGDMEQGRHKKVSYKSEKTVWVPKSQWIIVPGTHEPIIDPDTFARVQALLAGKARGGTDGSISPFAGKVFCGLCGASMEQTGAGASHTGAAPARRYFRCRTSQRDKARCGGQAYLPKKALEDTVLERMRGYVAQMLTPDCVSAAFISTETQQQRRAQQAQLQRLHTDVERRRKAMQELYLDKSAGFISGAQFMQLNEAYLREVAQYEQQIMQAEQQVDSSANDDKQRQAVVARLQELAQVPQLTRELVCLLIQKIIVHPPNDTAQTREIEIHWRF